MNKLRQEGTQEPSWSKIAEIVGGSADVVEATVAGSRATVSLSQPATVSERESLEARFLTNHDGSHDPEQPFAMTQLKVAIDVALGTLDPLDRRIVELRIGRVK